MEGAAAGTVSAGARAHDGEPITHIISPQIDAASRRNWRFSRCLRANVSIPFFCFLYVSVRRPRVSKKRRESFFSPFLMASAVDSTQDGFFFARILWQLKQEWNRRIKRNKSRISQRSQFVPFSVNHLQHILFFSF